MGDGCLSKLNFHILPSANPDGYEYSRNSDRMWRKNRCADHDSIEGCIGVDLNRNWGFHFAEGGGDTDKCSDEYQGPYAFSEIENQNIQNYVLQLDPVPIWPQACIAMDKSTCRLMVMLTMLTQ